MSRQIGQGAFLVAFGFALAAIERSSATAALVAHYKLDETVAGPVVNQVGANGTNVGATINLITPNSSFGDRFSQLDVAVSKNLNIGWGSLRLAFDVYNVLNSNSIQNVTTAYGARWLRPATFLDPRLARITAALQF